MDTALAGMILTLLLTIIIGGFILLFPLSRRLAALLEQRVRDRAESASDAERLEPLREALHALQADLERLTERQEFMERVLEERSQREALPSSAPAPTDPD